MSWRIIADVKNEPWSGLVEPRVALNLLQGDTLGNFCVETEVQKFQTL